MKWKWKEAEIERYEQEWRESIIEQQAGIDLAKKGWKAITDDVKMIPLRAYLGPNGDLCAEKGDGWVKFELFLNDDLHDETSINLYQGVEGGCLTFNPNGKVGVQWNDMAAIASAHGKNRKARVTVSTGKRRPPEAAYLFERIQQYRLAALNFDAKGYPFPKSSDDPGVAELLSDDLRQPAWTMMSAVLNGDSATLRKIADMVELAEKIRLEGEAFTPKKSWEEIENAISIAAEKAGKPPTREAVYKELHKLNPNVTMDSLIGNLGRMGFGWLGGKTGRPRKPKTPKPSKSKKVGRKRGE